MFSYIQGWGFDISYRTFRYTVSNVSIYPRVEFLMNRIESFDIWTYGISIYHIERLYRISNVSIYPSVQLRYIALKLSIHQVSTYRYRRHPNSTAHNDDTQTTGYVALLQRQQATVYTSTYWRLVPAYDAGISRMNLVYHLLFTDLGVGIITYEAAGSLPRAGRFYATVVHISNSQQPLTSIPCPISNPMAASSSNSLPIGYRPFTKNTEMQHEQPASSKRPHYHVQSVSKSARYDINQQQLLSSTSCLNRKFTCMQQHQPQA